MYKDMSLTAGQKAAWRQGVCAGCGASRSRLLLSAPPRLARPPPCPVWGRGSWAIRNGMALPNGSWAIRNGMALPKWNGMALPNATLEQLGHKIKEEEIITVSANAEGEEAATWAAKCAEQKQQYPSRTLCYSVSLALQALNMEKQENRDISCALWSEGSKLRKWPELAMSGMGNNAARKRCAMAVPKSALAK